MTEDAAAGLPSASRQHSLHPGAGAQLDSLFGALADSSRRQVIGYLSAQGTATATELTGELPMTRQAVAKHLATLADAGLVESERRGRETRYRLTEAGEEWDERLDGLRRHLSRGV